MYNIWSSQESVVYSREDGKSESPNYGLQAND